LEECAVKILSSRHITVDRSEFGAFANDDNFAIQIKCIPEFKTVVFIVAGIPETKIEDGRKFLTAVINAFNDIYGEWRA
jgi:hypothetical protein